MASSLAPAPSRFLARPQSVGVFSLPAALLLCLLAPQAALRGWLAAFFLAFGAGLGGLILLAMMRLIPGAWSRDLAPSCTRLAAALPRIALGFLPILAGAGWLYPWGASAGKGAFRETWMTQPFWTFRALLFLALVLAFPWLLRASRARAVPVLGLILLVASLVPIAVDWFLALDPAVHFSGFALTVIVNFVLAALCLSILFSLRSGWTEAPAVLGGLLLTVLLLWAYLSFMQYFISWSENLPQAVAWYRQRGHGVWGVAEQMFSALRLVPLLLLMAAPVRTSPRWLQPLAIAVLAGNAVEAVWLVTPGSPGAALSVLAALLGLAGLPLALGRRWSGSPP